MEQNENLNDEKKAQEEEIEAKPSPADKDAKGEKKENKPEHKKEEVDYKSKYFYIAAEMENYRKRMERERENLVKFGNERVLSDLLQVMDNFERTIEMLRHDEDQKIKNIVTGI